MAKIKNLSGAVVYIGSTSIRPGVTATIENWNVHRHSDQAIALLNAKVIEVVEEKTEEPKSEPMKARTKKEPVTAAPDVAPASDD